MLTRRSLFARLSAVALAPLVKWVPKAEDYVVGCDVGTGDWITVGMRYCPIRGHELWVNGVLVDEVDYTAAYTSIDNNEHVLETKFRCSTSRTG